MILPGTSQTFPSVLRVILVAEDWLDELLATMPNSATVPRLMTARHPEAVGSWGDECLQLAESLGLQPKRSAGTRWWQRLVLGRALECDEDGMLVWPMVMLSAPRQTGKSWLERMVCAWRLHQADWFGEEQAVLHMAHKLVAAQEVWRPAARALSQSAKVRWTNGEQQIELDDGSRWMIQAANDGAGVSFSLAMALIDEAWRVPRQVADEAILPTMAESTSPQLWLVSTAGTSDSDLMMVNRATALAELEEPKRGSTLLLEWSAPPDPDLDIDDVSVWRGCAPHWDDRRGDRMATARVKATERAFRQQWLNQWVPSTTTPMLDERLYASAVTVEALFGPVSFAVEVTPDRSVASVVACAGGIIEVVTERAGVAWVAGYVADLVLRHDAVAVAFDSLGPAASVGEELRDVLGQRLMMLTGREVAAASGLLYDRLTAEPVAVGIRHSASLHQAVLQARQRRYGQTWAFARDVIAGVSGAPLAAAALALYASEHAPAEVPLAAPTIW